MNFRSGRMRFGSSKPGLARKLHAWLELFRLPNLLTVPGDALAGACLVSLFSGRSVSAFELVGVGLCVLLLYAMGLVQNDLVDMSEDRYLRPERPLPSKRISTSQAVLAFFVCFLGGILVAFCNGRVVLIGAGLLTILIWSYNLILKKRYYGGALGMGLCRGMSLLVGASTVGWHIGIVPVFLALTAYVYLVTLFAEGENRRQVPDGKVFLPLACFFAGGLGCLPILLYHHSRISGVSLLLSVLCFLLALLAAGAAGVQVYNRSVRAEEMRHFIGALLRGLLPWQACWLVLSGGTWTIVTMVILLLLWPLTILLNREFSQS
jgi:hypothetical protein